MYNLTIKGKEKEVTFSGLVFNDNEELEFKNVDVNFLDGFTFIFNEEKGKLELRGYNSSMFLDLDKEQVKNLSKIKQETRDYIIDLYMGILKGDEGLLFLDIGLKEFPYMVTSRSILDAKIKSPKYNNALLYVFSEKVLKANKKNAKFKFNNYEELQRELGNKVKKEGIKPNFNLDGQKVIRLEWNQLVS